MAEETSKRYSLNVAEQKKVWHGFLIALAGVALTKALEIVMQTDFGPWSEIIVGATSFGVQFLRKYLQGE